MASLRLICFLSHCSPQFLPMIPEPKTIIFNELIVLFVAPYFIYLYEGNVNKSSPMMTTNEQAIKWQFRALLEGEEALNRRFTVEVFDLCLKRKCQVGFQVGVIGSQRFPGHIGKRFFFLDTQDFSHPSFLFIPGHGVALLQSTHSGVKIDTERHGPCRCDACCCSFYAGYSSSATAIALINSKVNRQSCTVSWLPWTPIPC